MYDAISRQLYTAAELLEGFNPWDQMGFALTRDFAIYRQFVSDGGPVPTAIAVRLTQARHDAEIADALRRFLLVMQRPLVGVMGGHGVRRDSVAYRDVSFLARNLAREGFLIVTGGGPGIMEAAHVGVAFSTDPDEGRLNDALSKLSEAPKAPVLDALFADDGTIKESKFGDLVDARNWLEKALEVRRAAPATMPVSLAIPTWLYGAEPTMPFATHYAKYFQNSLREDALIGNSRAGIVYGRGGGGTMREIFQDVERNYYVSGKLDDLTPMIFFDGEGYWEREPGYDDPTKIVPGIKIDGLVRSALQYGLRTAGRFPAADVTECLDRKLLFTDDFGRILSALKAHSSASRKNLDSALASQPMKLQGLRMNRR